MTKHKDFRDGFNGEQYTGEIRVARLILCTAHQWFTWADNCQCDRATVPTVEKFTVIGGGLGQVTSIFGALRFWDSRSGARHYLVSNFANKRNGIK